MKLVHTADWQLGKPYGRFEPEVRAALTEARFDAIDAIGKAATLHGADHVFVAGDVFDTEGPEDRTIVQAISRMERHRCRWWLLPGNHDFARMADCGIVCVSARAAPSPFSLNRSPKRSSRTSGCCLPRSRTGTISTIQPTYSTAWRRPGHGCVSAWLTVRSVISGRRARPRTRSHPTAEELIAEIGAAMLCAQLGMEPTEREDHAAYLASWLTALRNDKRAIFRAATAAQAASELILSHMAAPVMARAA
ncbi:metallophosphoesterase family protein [Novosphingobium sp. Rr 2-17]|uniref:metallophosphoesterase family protein n=1 Tax=Novosphingobium sp. Rr 2-17 TaxID=555793 RepID=UPI0002DBEB2E|nr:zincin-like metallopeptidase domain-containing protein [Novosphingobium sp. Rr 2-17]